MLNFPAVLEHLIPMNLYLTGLSRSKFMYRSHELNEELARFFLRSKTQFYDFTIIST